MNNILIINEILIPLHSWRVADARVIGRKNTNNGMKNKIIRNINTILQNISKLLSK